METVFSMAMRRLLLRVYFDRPILPCYLEMSTRMEYLTESNGAVMRLLRRSLKKMSP